MNLKSFFKRLFIIEETIEIRKSDINGEIKVTEDLFGQKSLIVGGVSQSGYLVEKLWRNAILQISNFKYPSKEGKQISNFKCLILGLGAGNVVKVLNKYFPEIQITGVEIDKEIISLGKKYFNLQENKNLKIIIEDAIKFIHDSLFMIHNSKFDLILVDLYLGQDFISTAETEKFISNIKSLLNKNGLVIFNRLYYGKKKKEVEEFVDYLKTYFPNVKTKKTVTNLIIYCQIVS